MCSAYLTRHGGGWDVHGHPTPASGRSLTSGPMREGYRRGGAGASQSACSTMPDRPTARRSANGCSAASKRRGTAFLQG